MEPKVINLKYEMPVEELESMAETATMGIGYWAVRIDGQPLNGRWSEFEESDQVGDYEVKLTGKNFILDADLIAKGIERMATEGSPGWHSIAKYVIGNEGGADIDACDALVQYGVFGELVYG